MAEDNDTSEKVLNDLDKLDIDDLRLMARQNGLCFDGEKIELLNRIKTSFGFENKNEESNDPDFIYAQNLQRNEKFNKSLQSCTEEEGKIYLLRDFQVKSIDNHISMNQIIADTNSQILKVSSKCSS